MSTYVDVTIVEMDTFLTAQGFRVITLPDTNEAVYGKLLEKNVCLRVFTGIINSHSRLCGKDAIRVCIVRRYPPNNFIRGMQSSRRVHRVKGWKVNLQSRINEMVQWYKDNC